MLTEADYGTFERAFGRVCGAFRLRLTATERQDLTRTYFKVLEPYDLEQVLQIGRRCLERYKKFPTVSDWIAELDDTARTRRARTPEARHMTVSEVEERTSAERQRYSDAPCTCVACRAAGVEDHAIRYVPTLVGDEEERAWDPQRQRLEIVGHWAHGAELRRWYEARAAFFARAKRRPFGRAVLALVAVSREPGEEG